MVIIEQTLGDETLVTIIQLRGLKLRFVTGSSATDIVVTDYEHNVSSIARINEFCFVVLEHNSNNVRLLNFDSNGSRIFEDKLIYRDPVHDIVKILADNNKMYVLSRSGPEHFLKCFCLKPNFEVAQTGALSNLEQSNPTFIDEFKKSFTINGDIILASD